MMRALFISKQTETINHDVYRMKNGTYSSGKKRTKNAPKEPLETTEGQKNVRTILSGQLKIQNYVFVRFFAICLCTTCLDLFSIDIW